MEQVSNTLQRIMARGVEASAAGAIAPGRMGLCRRTSRGRKNPRDGCNLCDQKQTLLVEVPDATWRAQLYAMAPQFLARLNQFLRIERIEFKLARPQDAPRKV